MIYELFYDKLKDHAVDQSMDKDQELSPETCSHKNENRNFYNSFQSVVKKYPDEVIVLDGNKSFTYREVMNQVDDFLRILENSGVEHDVIGLLVTSEVNLLISMLGIFKTGGTCIFLNPELSETKINSVLQKNKASLLILEEKQANEKSFIFLAGIEDSNCTVKLSAKRKSIEDLNQLPIPNRSLIDYERYKENFGHSSIKNCLAIQATRGCPYKCYYCHKIWPKKQVCRSAENIYEEVEKYYKVGVKRFCFVDDTFNLNIKNSKKFLELIIKNKLDVQLFFANGLRGDILTEEYVDLLYEAGLAEIALALESGSPRIQKLIKKNLDLDKFQNIIDYIGNTYPQIITRLYSIIGFPTETEEEALMTLDFVMRNKKIHFPYSFFLKIYPGTDMATLAMENGISLSAIKKAEEQAFHEIPDTLQLSKEFVRKFQMDFYLKHLLSRERLLNVLPYQLQFYGKEDLVRQYNVFLADKVESIDELFMLMRIKKKNIPEVKYKDSYDTSIKDVKKKFSSLFPSVSPSKDALRILLIDLSQHFSRVKEAIASIVVPPLGLIYLSTYLYNEFKSDINCKIVSSCVDFDKYSELKQIIDEFEPDVVGVRSLSMYKNFFHRTVLMIRQFGFRGSIIAGGPYATSGYSTMLKDKNIDLAVLGEGEVTFAEVINTLIKNKGTKLRYPDLEAINGIAFLSREEAENKNFRKMFIFESPGNSDVSNPGSDEYGFSKMFKEKDFMIY